MDEFSLLNLFSSPQAIFFLVFLFVFTHVHLLYLFVLDAISLVLTPFIVAMYLWLLNSLPLFKLSPLTLAVLYPWSKGISSFLIHILLHHTPLNLCRTYGTTNLGLYRTHILSSLSELRASWICHTSLLSSMDSIALSNVSTFELIPWMVFENQLQAFHDHITVSSMTLVIVPMR